ncbi:hypothetical protein [Nocardia arthritidis]|uniref:Uncharacterized protein n=1 Tax=Nocardia arthritidis TaxID=228602 RepID=A0A6G9YGJ7_9NOCA|nr:hypothetical protein [Nocardia arthritidis]QIS12176.1 hypothetical protein F5544_21565 [Nocardia arthritidis]
MNSLDTHPRGGIRAAEPPRCGARGMTVFGTGVDCYLANRPTFESPHNYQTLLDIELDERGRRALGTDRRIGYDGTHTFEPEFFPIAELDPRAARPRTRFRGTLVRGRAERGGIPIAREVTATVRTVMYFAELDPCGAGRVPTHLCFGRGGRLYLAHRIARRPSFDQIVSVRFVPGTRTDLVGSPLSEHAAEPTFERAQPIILGRRGFGGNRLRVREVAVAAFYAVESSADTSGFLVELEVGRQIHLEVADLS